MKTLITRRGIADAMSDKSGPFVASIDQGTSSSRCIIFDRQGGIVSSSNLEHTQFYPQPGWVEHDAEQIWVIKHHMYSRVL